MGATKRATTSGGVLAVGYVAAALTTASQMPQVIKVFRTNRVRDLSFAFYLMLLVGAGIWVAYGALQEDYVVVVANIFTVCFCSYIAYKIYRGRKCKQL